MTAESEVLPPTGSDVVEYRQTEAALATLRAQLADATIDCTTTAGDKQARDSRLTLVRLRTALEDKRKELKAPHLEAGKRIDDEAKRITGAILEMEQPIDAAIKAEEQRRERARQERERIERERKARNEGLIDGVKHLPLEHVCAPASVVEEALALQFRTLGRQTLLLGAIGRLDALAFGPVGGFLLVGKTAALGLGGGVCGAALFRGDPVAFGLLGA